MAELDTIIRIIHMHVGVRDLFDGAQELTGVERAGKAILEALPRSVLGEIAARRQHQIAKGYDASHDDGHVDGSIARGAAAFALAASGPVTIKADRKRVGMYRGQESLAIYPSTIWPWENGFHASGPRDALIDAAAMIVAEIERLDRACPSDANILNGVSTITGAELSPGVPPKMLVDADWLRRKVETDPDMDADVLPELPHGSAENARPKEAPEWIWYGEVNGNPVVSYGRWPKHGAVWRYKYAEIQPTEHDHGGRAETLGEAFERIIKALQYDGPDTNSLTVGEIRRALP